MVECGSFSKAADKLYTSPVSIMKIINNLENDIGLKLLQRTNHGVFLTSAGCLFYDDTKSILAYYDKSIERAKAIAAADENMIKIGTSILRPCSQILNLWAKIDDGNLPFQFKIIPFNDSPEGMNSVLKALGSDIDCFVHPCDSPGWMKQYNMFILGHHKSSIAISRKNKLAKKKILSWADLIGEKLLLLEKGISSCTDAIRDDINKNHHGIHIVELNYFYDQEVFNRCAQNEYLVLTLDSCTPINPSIVTLPVDWNYKLPYGIIYSKQPSKAVTEFINKISSLKE